MKKLRILQINPERVMKNEDLLKLRGGYGEQGIWMKCTCLNGETNPPYASPWEKCYASGLDAAADVGVRCVSGGKCENQYQWCLVQY